MAREEQEREDLLAEATALVERIELRVRDWPQTVVAGFRRDGAASFYLSPEEVYQFNSERQLRRGYLNGRLLKAEQGRLAWLTRHRTASEVQLLRHDLTEQEASAFLQGARERLVALLQRMTAAQCEVVGQHPADADVLGRVRQWLASLEEPIAAARNPYVG